MRILSGHERQRLRRGILAHADQNLLLVDEVNILADDVVDAISGCSSVWVLYSQAGYN